MKFRMSTRLQLGWGQSCLSLYPKGKWFQIGRSTFVPPRGLRNWRRDHGYKFI